MPGGVTGLLQGAGQHWSRRIEPLSYAAFPVALPVVEVGGDFPTLRILSGGNGGSRGRTNRRVDVKLLKPNSFFGELVNPGSFGVTISKTGKVGPSHVVDEHENDVWFAAAFLGGRSHCAGKNPNHQTGEENEGDRLHRQQTIQ